MKKIYLIMFMVAFTLIASIQKNYAQCGVSFTYSILPDSVFFTVSHPDSVVGTYSWNFGDGSTSTVPNPVHAYSTSGTFVVTVNFISSDSICTPSYSDSVVIAAACNLTATATSTNTSCSGCSDGSAYVTATGGTMPYTYYWNNGTTTTLNSGLFAGEYSVTVTDAAACTFTTSVMVSEPAATSFSMTGSVYASGTPVDIYWLTFYRQDSATAMYYNYADEVVSDSLTGYFTVTDFIPGQYLVKASPHPGSTVSAGFLPTYYGDSTSWNGATPIIVTNNNITEVFINLVYQTVTDSIWNTGDDIITGVITQDTTGFGGKMAAGTPVRNTTVNMFSSGGDFLAYQLTNDNGEFKFSGITAGNYGLKADFPGYNMSVSSVSLDGDSTTSTSISMDMDQTGTVVVGIYTTSKMMLQNISVYPNPAKDIVTITSLPFNRADAQLKITSLLGQVLMDEQINLTGDDYKINVAGWKQGIYLISIQTKETTSLGKLIIQD